MSEAATLITEAVLVPTPLAGQLQARKCALDLSAYSGSLTPQAFSSTQSELATALSEAGCFDLGYRTRIRITGEDRVRWLNGMVSNSIQTLSEGQGNYNFILNAQGRIQGDCYIYRRASDVLLDTDRSQTSRLFSHLDHFIIMDDVELHSLDGTTTGIGVIGPHAVPILEALGLPAPVPLQLLDVELAGTNVTLVHAFGELPRFELWFAPENALHVWNALSNAGATPIGTSAIEALRVFEGTPRFGVDINDRHLPQETSQTRALNFAKGCYLGQEIVERIRSRATVHRTLRHFELDGTVPALPADLYTAENRSASIGQLTSVAEIDIAQHHKTFAIGTIRTEPLERKSAIVYEGGTAIALNESPVRQLP